MTRGSVIDCDIHCTVPSIRALFPYLSDYWIETIEQTGQRGDRQLLSERCGPLRPPGTAPRAAPAASDLELVRSQALDRQNVELAILNCAYAVDGIRNPYGAAAVASAVNDWLIAEWLDKEPRLRASIVVTPQYPDLAVKEIDRVAGHLGLRPGLPARPV